MLRSSRLLVFCCLALFVPASLLAQSAPNGERPTNVILLIPDGFGPASSTMARDYLRWRDGSGTLTLDSLETGSVRTFAANSRVTDSAAGATAYSAGVKTDNGAIAVDTLEQPVGTILEAAEARGMATGLVATSRITHATPASFAVHVPDRWMENTIAVQELSQGIDVLLGGGRRHFLPESKDGRREDDRNLIDEATADGYTYVSDRDGFLAASGTPLLGLFSMSHMDYEMDRDPDAQPSLAEMTEKTLDLLSQDDDGFFVMIEGSRIDHAGHSNDAAAHLHDILAFDDAVASAVEFAKADGNTLVVVVSDHETGGMSLGRDGDYAWHPDVLDRVTASHGVMLDAMHDVWPDDPTDERRSAVDDVLPILAEHAGIESLSPREHVDLQDALGNRYVFEDALAELIAQRTRIGWTTGGHTAVDVKLHAYGPGHEHFRANLDNTDVGKRLAALLGMDLEALTTSLRAEAESSSSVGSR